MPDRFASSLQSLLNDEKRDEKREVINTDLVARAVAASAPLASHGVLEYSVFTEIEHELRYPTCADKPVSDVTGRTTFEKLTGFEKEQKWNPRVLAYPMDAEGVDLVFVCSDDTRCGFSTHEVRDNGPSGWGVPPDRKGGMKAVLVPDFPSSIVCTAIKWMSWSVRELKRNATEWFAGVGVGWGVHPFRWLTALCVFAKQYHMTRLYDGVLSMLLQADMCRVADARTLLFIKSLSPSLLLESMLVGVCAWGPLSGTTTTYPAQIAETLIMQSILKRSITKGLFESPIAIGGGSVLINGAAPFAAKTFVSELCSILHKCPTLDMETYKMLCRFSRDVVDEMLPRIKNTPHEAILRRLTSK
jgi:hypothetical protein